MKKTIKIILSSIIITGIFGMFSIKNIETTNKGILVTFKNNTGYFMEK